MKLSADQKKAGFFEFAIGVPLNILLFWLLYAHWLPDYRGMDLAANRLQLALACAALPAASMLLGLWAVALSRGTSKAIDPLKGLESPTLQIHIRYLQNTLEQTVLYVIAALSLSLFLSAETVNVLPATAVLFFVNRLLFWFGYLKDPMLRGAGLSGTLYPISIMVVAAVWNAFGWIVSGG